MDAQKLEQRREAKKLQKEIARIESEKNQKPVSEIVINIEWKRSTTWGPNPNCEARVHFKDGDYETSPTFKCSGCGYDKESTVIADVFNQYLKYKLWQKAAQILKPKKEYSYNPVSHIHPYGIYLPSKDYNRVSFNGRVGTNCYKQISEFIGGKFEHVSGGKSFDVYKYTDNEGE